MIGAGKYDAACAEAGRLCGATGCILIVVDGQHGPGFSAHLTGEMVLKIPTALRQVADQIEADQEKGQL